ncbi:hypothetical protein DDB_G0288573 [Dictyostelium discoideum AX4]|uniref:Uncharacterized protein n=1 Tax=Dictyostelium discoideum TaxID=44689 RepID=Q54IR6_DICDI|nr:hypothetical protein DDB_G0288573 [Dictyostelium discoideum AX4]EAL63146.1 hypothetical protein DDB_G0288573 [Dictyostelium discoideum AX4]|eukprot:XP_636648.1 hypothetical protein DDB_G0288573 [Dictyostelium discoideum AX4]
MQNPRALANISNQAPSLQKQQKKAVLSQPTPTNINIVNSAPRSFSVYTQETELENAYKKIKELEEQNKLKDQIIKDQELTLLLLTNSNDYSDKLTIKQTNNRLRKIQQQNIEIESLKEKREEDLYNNEKSDILDKKLTQHRIRSIQKLKAENQELRQLNSNNSKVVNVNIVNEEQLNQSLQTITVSSQPQPQLQLQSPTQVEQSKRPIYQYDLDFDYGMDNQHVGEC